MKIGLDKAVHAFIGFMADQVAQIPKLGDRFLLDHIIPCCLREPPIVRHHAGQPIF